MRQTVGLFLTILVSVAGCSQEKSAAPKPVTGFMAEARRDPVRAAKEFSRLVETASWTYMREPVVVEIEAHIVERGLGDGRDERVGALDVTRGSLGLQTS